MAREFARSFVAKIAEHLAGALIAEYFVRLLGREFGYVIFHRSYLDKLREEGKKLEEKSGAVQLSVDLGRRNRGIIGPDVQGWLERAKECIDEASEILEDENRGCLNGWCPNLNLRHSLGRKAANKAKEVAHLNQEVPIAVAAAAVVNPLAPITWMRVPNVCVKAPIPAAITGATNSIAFLVCMTKETSHNSSQHIEHMHLVHSEAFCNHFL
ncbi:hypothetical protein HYC85_025239 [Camellia sinensis]|uniref:Uncharacterized protein n=1 Tax=Camellia sinensis TaxID=4442 RepID=A0A7J7GAF4_CAMSI|nr:hypothetical protein HYC85_025239 [Camellia sinensis]